MDLKIQKIEDKVEKLDVCGQGCLDDCYVSMWVGNTSSTDGCVKLYTYNAQTTTWW